MSIDLTRINNVYFVGIKGVGMTALAQVLKSKGINISGSDTKEKFFTDAVLKRLRIPVFEEFKKKNVPRNADLVVVSAAYLPKFKNQNEKLKITDENSKISNPEIKEVLRKKIPILSYPEAIGFFFKDYRVIAVAGTHGKSTTTAMLGVILEKARLDPTVIVGTRVNQWESNARAGDNQNSKSLPILVVEADEYREAFLNYSPQGLIITSVEYDHPDYFKTFQAYKNAFRKLVRKVPPEGFIVANWDDMHVRDAVQNAKCKVIRYGKKDMKQIKLAIPGEFNKLNAAAAVAAASELGVKKITSRRAVFNFQGTARRFEILRDPRKLKSKKLKTIIIDDYAHHPTEIQVTLRAAREQWPKREIWVVFQPHTYSRTAALLGEFAKSFHDADRVFIFETYASAREERGRVGARELVHEIAKYHSSVQYVNSIPIGTRALKRELRGKNAVLITMGAGDVWKVGELLNSK